MADFGEALPYDALLHSDVAARSFHNQYPEEWAQLNREAIPGSWSRRRCGVLYPIGISQSPGSSTLFWLGDQLVTWDVHDGLRSAVVGMLSGGVSGFSLNHSDAGGLHHDCEFDPESEAQPRAFCGAGWSFRRSVR